MRFAQRAVEFDLGSFLFEGDVHLIQFILRDCRHCSIRIEQHARTLVTVVDTVT
jgi:hypothetical protein